MTVSSTSGGICPRSWAVKHPLVSFVRVGVAIPLVLLAAAWASPGAESSAPPAAASQSEATNAQEVIRTYLQLQEQLRATQLAIEQNRQDTKETVAQNADALSKGLLAVQEAFAVQRARDWETMQRTNNAVLVVAGTFAAISFLTMLMIAYFQWRMSKGLAQISAALPPALALGPVPAVAALSPAELAQLRLPGVVEQPGKHNHEPEPSPRPVLRRREGTGLPLGNRLFPIGGTPLEGRRVRALRTAVIVGLICAAVLALLLYVLTYGKLGLGPLRAVLKI